MHAALSAPPVATAPEVLLVAPAGLRERMALLARGAGLRPVARAGLALVVTPGDAVPAEVDALTVDSVPHLLLAVHRDRVRLGPFVVPGSTACARCLTAGMRESLALPHPPGPAPDPAAVPWPLVTAAVGWAARDVQAWESGATPATWSTTWDLGTDPLPRRRDWPRHPWCGCSWWDA